MPASIGVNLRVTGNCRQGGRKYMEDCFSVAYQQTEDEKDLEYAFFGIYDGHGGVEAASFAKEHLMETIIKHKNFWSDNDEDVLRAIKDGYIATHYAMWREQYKWPKTSSGLPSTAGTTASVAFIRRGKIYIGHVGDSGIILGYQEPGSQEWKAKQLTKDHKPENPEEMKRIESCGGKVVAKSGVPRVVWNRPKIGHQGPVRRSTPIDEIPFLAVARSLGDLWSYNSQIDQFVVSPDPDCSVLTIDTNVHRCLIFGTDGLFNMLSAAQAVHIVQQAERHNESEALSDDYNKVWLNPSKLLVEKALDRWHATKMRADNTSAVTLMLDPPGPPRAQVLKDRKKNLPASGLKIMTRYDSEASQQQPCPQENNLTSKSDTPTPKDVSQCAKPELPLVTPETVPQTTVLCEKNTKDAEISAITTSSEDISSNYPLKERNFVPKLRDSTSFDPREPHRPSDAGKENNTLTPDDNSIQIHEISSSNIEETLHEEETNATVVQNPDGELAKKSSSKRKFENEDGQQHQQRKSLRLSSTQKNAEESKKPAPCTLAEEKLKRLAEAAEKLKLADAQPAVLNTRETVEDTKNETTQTSLTQKILRSKQIGVKKKVLVKRQLNRRKLKVILETIIPRSSRSKTASNKVGDIPANLTVANKRSGNVEVVKSKKNTEKPMKSQENREASLQDKNSEVSERRNKKVVIGVKVQGKLSNFKRQSMRNASQKLKEVPTKAQLVKGEFKKPAADVPKKEVKVPKNAEDSPRKGRLQVLNTVRETRRTTASLPPTLVGNKSDTKENIKQVITKGEKKLPGSRNSLRQRIQDKTKTLKRSVLKRSR